MLHPTWLSRARISFQPIAQLSATTGVLNRKKVAPIKCHFPFQCFIKKFKTTYDIALLLHAKPLRFSRSRNSIAPLRTLCVSARNLHYYCNSIFQCLKKYLLSMPYKEPNDFYTVPINRFHQLRLSVQ